MRRIVMLGLVGGVAMAAALASGCGSDAKSNDINSFLDQRATDECNWLFRCCSDPELKQLEGTKYTDQAGCVAYQKLTMQSSDYFARLAVTQSRLKLDNDAAKACLAEVTGRACSAPDGSQPPPPADDPCTRVLKGATPVGQPCDLVDECVAGSRCVFRGNDRLGICVPFQHETEVCNSSNDCDPTSKKLYCAAKDSRCHHLGLAGEPCAYTIDAASSKPRQPLLLACDTGLFCEPTSSTCKALPHDGEPCVQVGLSGDRCATDPALALRCVVEGTDTNGTCRAPGKAGDPCSGQRVCQTSLFCDGSTPPATCKTPQPVGQPCTTSLGCQTGAFCNFAKSPAVCDALPTAGQPCANGLCSDGLYCDFSVGPSTCKLKLPDGSACQPNQPQMCQGNRCDFTTQTCGRNVICSGR